MSIIEITVTLEDIVPQVVRKLEVPADIRLDRLHLVLQAAMGWTNSHLYIFEAAGATWGLADPDFGSDDLPANKTTLQELIEDTGVRTFTYLYDFGDSWEHKLRIGKMTEPVPGELYPRLTDIKGTCPPEDIGGVPRYYYFLEALADSNHPEHDEMKEWHGEGFDPEKPDTNALRRHVSQLAKRRKPGKR